MDEMLERRILIGMIYDRYFMAQINPIVDLKYFRTKESKQIARLAKRVYEKYGDVAGDDIVAKLDDSQDSSLLLDFIISIKDDEKKINAEFLFDQAIEYFQKQNLENFATEIQMYLAGNDVKSAQELAETFKPVTKDTLAVVDPSDRDAIISAFEYEQETVVRYPGKLGWLLNDLFVRDGFVGVMAPEKRGKTWFLMDVAMRAWRQGKKVAFFEVGDMVKRQLLRRIYTWILKTPLGDGKKEIEIPTLNCSKHLNGTCKLPIRSNEDICVECLKRGDYKRFMPIIENQTKKVKMASADKVFEEVKKFVRRARPGKMKLAFYPMNTISVAGIDSVLKAWKDSLNFVPDLIVIDYADILAPEAYIKDQRHQINETWKALRKLSQEWHNLVITATQSDIAGHDTDHLEAKNFSEDKRKLSHVTAMIGLNKVGEQYGDLVYGVNIIVAREKFYNNRNVVRVGSSFDIGRPYLFSF